jgi:hypothetical protein
VTKRIHILGAEWTIHQRKLSNDTKLENCNGYCDWTLRQIVVEKSEPDPMNLGDMVAFEKKVLRHEIVHAFLRESGLGECTTSCDSGWANCEEMVDWFALQGPKIYDAWREAGAL